MVVWAAWYPRRAYVGGRRTRFPDGLDVGRERGRMSRSWQVSLRRPRRPAQVRLPQVGPRCHLLFLVFGSVT